MDPKELPNASEICDVFRLLAVDTRLEILLTLRSQSLCVGALAARLGLTQGAVSQHLKLLRDAGLLMAARDGHFVHYRVDEELLAGWLTRICDLLGAAPGSRHREDDGSRAPARSPCSRSSSTHASEPRAQEGVHPNGTSG
ncbi:MAG TPA: ArsR family transcriptional regulator [Candidatus Acetothermia bacterium]|nr:ArsR family transcriptional regulator [Candidatus Acetothermia bacterium]